VSEESSGIRFQRPRIPSQTRIDSYFAQAREARWFSNFGPCVSEFEQRVSRELLSGFPVCSVGNATLGLMVALRAVLGEPCAGRDRVLVPSFTFVGSLAAVVWSGFRPQFVDVDPDDWQPSPQSLRAAGNDERLAGALLTTTFGTPWTPDRESEIRDALDDHSLPLVLDSAAGLGSCAPSGRTGSATVYSLHATKPFAVGEGGLICSPDSDVVRRSRQLSNFGFDEDHGLGAEVGINAKLSEIHGAIGLAVLDEFPTQLVQRRNRALELLEEVSSYGLRPQLGHARSTFQFLPMLCADHHHRATLLDLAQRSRVQVRAYFDPPMHRVPAFRADVDGELPVTEDLAARIVCLPMADDLSEEESAAIAAVCRRARG